MKKGIILFASALLIVANSCTKFDAPALTAPSISTVQESTTTELTFNYSADAGFKSSSVSATNGSATIQTDGVDGGVSGTITVSSKLSSFHIGNCQTL